MRRSILVVGMVAGLLLLLCTVSLAGEGPYGLTDNGQLLPRISRGLEKESPGAFLPFSGPTTNIDAGISRTGATFCDGQWQGAAMWLVRDWYQGDEFYAVYQDPETLGTCAGFPDVYAFDVTAVRWFVAEYTGGSFYDMQPLVYDNDDFATCAIPGQVLCAGPLYSIHLPSLGSYIVTLPFPDECCVYDDYFAGVYSGPFVGPGDLYLVIDDGVTVPSEECHSYNDYGSGWTDLVSEFGFDNLLLWSEGTAFDQNTCPGIPADFCDWLDCHGSAAFSWTDPDGNGATDRWSYFIPDFLASTECTLMSARITLYDVTSAGTPTMRVRVYGDNGPIVGATHYPAQNSNPPGTDPNLIAEIDIPYANLDFWPAATTVDFTTVPGWPSDFIFTTYERFFISVSLSPNTPNPGTDVLSVMSDDGSGYALKYSGAYFGSVSSYLTNDEAFGVDYDWMIDAYLCCSFEDHPPNECEGLGPDDWNTWAHDYERTCLSNIEVGDPCQVTAAWTQPLTGALNSFCEPTIADGRVYVSIDNALRLFDLNTGAPKWTVSGLPHIFALNRGNMTIEGEWVYVTGGNGQAINQFSLDLSFNNWVNGLPAVGNGPLGANCRFGVTAVYDIAGTEVVVVGTENTFGNGGYLWCFETATGAAYSGWPINPRILPEGIWHSPSYDGTDLFVGTANPSAVAGQIYSIDAATGTINWTFTPIDPGEGFPGGVSVDGDFVYAASGNLDNTGSRIKLDKATGALQWEFPQARALYGVPAVGRNFLYINQDVNGAGVLVVDKISGAALYNFAVNGVGPVTQHVTATCDNYVFAGDRNGKWWLLDVNNQQAAWSVQFNGIVNGTALATDPSGGEFAVVSIRSGNSVDGGGYVAAFEFNAGTRPRVAQGTANVEINVPPSTGAGNPYSVADVLENTGCADLHITSHNIYDPAPDVAAKSFNDSQSRYATALANLTVGDDYTAYFDESSKRARLSKRSMELVDGELTRGDVAMENAAKAMVDSKRAGKQMAAASGVVRTSGVSYFATLPPDGSTDVDWVYDGTGLGRGIDVEEIEFVTDDPERILFGNQARITIRYIGGCLPDITSIVWNTLGAQNEEMVYNTGSLGDDDTDDDLLWGADPFGAYAGMLYDASFLLAGPHPPSADTAQLYLGNVYDYFSEPFFLPDPRPSDGQCGFDGETDVQMGWKRTGGCPGTPVEILGSWARASFVDSNPRFAGSFGEAIGLAITMTEIGAHDPLFGDFALLKWDMTERYGETESPVYAGTWADWDVPGDYTTNHGIISDNFNGYALWDHVTPGLAYGFLDPRMPTDYCGVNPEPYSPHRIQEQGMCFGGWWVMQPFCFWEETSYGMAEFWEFVVNDPPRVIGPHVTPDLLDDHFGWLINKPVSIGPYETKSVIQAKFAVDATSNDPATVEALATELARRAAIWSGYARGDVNMDGCVNLIDVCWTSSVLTGGLSQIYPDFYNGDVDLSGNVDMNDARYLLHYVTGIGPAPMGEWRFEF